MTSFDLYSTVMTGVDAAPVAVSERLDDPNETRARRVLNVAVAIVGLVIAAPIMAVIAFFVKLTSPGPIFYRQVRVGVDRRNPRLPVGNHRRAIDYGGAPFPILKFRT